ncbi:major facilitator superfamily domain-containing protein [Radiomyces spectabilis]|uniref:major facilitator superfamily domain-containing protein n=1 Tax=Radiomyces spectabilis TaxID=64574 RepID=UPI00222046B7|nr:major facilitator superfamily domain-containing protein [Radiomyces spectabilis]KAI8371749.1 major facilitator superfamily domain-containing protein [Radiomyces spectabilis]
MEKATRQLTNQSSKSYVEELVTTLDNGGPMIGPSMDTMQMDMEENYDRQDTLDQCEKGSSASTVYNTEQYPEAATVPSEKATATVATAATKHHPWWSLKRNDQDTDPRTYSSLKKHTILFIVAIAGAMSPLASTIYFPAIVTMQYAFNTTDTAMNASLSIFTFFTAFFPLLWATFGDIFGRRRIYLISFLISVVGSICCALSVNASMFIVFRGFSAIGSSSVMSMGAGTLADIFEPHERGRAFAWYTCGPLLGPALGPIIGGYLNQGLGWRSNFWFLAIFAFCLWLAILFFLPETLRPEALGPQKPPSVKEKQGKRWPWINPIAALNLLRFPNIALTVTFVGMLFMVFYLDNTTFTRTYTNQYGLDSGTVGLCYLPLAVGSMIGGIAGGRMSDRVYNKRVAQAEGGVIHPEMRISGVLFALALILQLCAFVAYGWCVQENVHFAFGLICQFFLGMALMLPNVTLSAYMVDCFRKKGASVTACNNFARYIMAGIGSLVASDLEHAMGDGPLFTVCGVAMIVVSVNLIIVKRKAKEWGELRKSVADS